VVSPTIGSPAELASMQGSGMSSFL